MKIRSRNAFTLIEVLIVVVIMAVLAATIIPQFSSSTKDAQESSVKFNANTMRAQLELYKAHHLGKYPTVANFVDQMTKATDAAGNLSGTGNPDATHPFGPYMQEIPANPFNNLRTIVAGVGGAGSGAGWQYDENTGNIYPDHSGYSGGTNGTTVIP